MVEDPEGGQSLPIPTNKSKIRLWFVGTVSVLLLVSSILLIVGLLVFRTTDRNAESRQVASIDFHLYGLTHQLRDKDFFENTCQSFFAGRLTAYKEVQCDIVEHRRRLQSTTDFLHVTADISGVSRAPSSNFTALVQDTVQTSGGDFVEALKENDSFQQLDSILAVSALPKTINETTSLTTFPVTLYPSTFLPTTFSPSTALPTIFSPGTASPTTARISTSILPTPTPSMTHTGGGAILVDRDPAAIRNKLVEHVGANNFLAHFGEAANWIINEDGLKLDSTSPSLIQRFVAASFYHATAPWSKCEPSRFEESCILEEYEYIGAVATIRQEMDIRWLSSSTECSWHGVECDGDGNIVTISLSRVGLNGTVPDFIHFFEHLESLSLEGDDLSGPLPHESFKKATTLRYLSLAHQPLAISVLDAIDAAKTIETVILDFTKLTGPLPDPLDTGNIRSFVAKNNNIDGTFPANTENARNLTSLDLSWNSISGSLPDSLGRMIGLQSLTLKSNDITGILPIELARLPNLKTLDASYNEISGTLPDFTSSLERLLVAGNQISGELVGFSTSVTHLDLSGNQINGTIPDSIYQCSNLAWLAVSNLQLYGTISSDIRKLTQLSFLRVDDNNFEGTIPDVVANMSALNDADFSNNNFVGRLNLCSAKRVGSDCLRNLDNVTEVECECCSWCCNNDDVCYGEHINDPLCFTDEHGTVCA